MWADSSVRPPLHLPVSLAISNLEDLGAHGGGLLCAVRPEAQNFLEVSDRWGV